VRRLALIAFLSLIVLPIGGWLAAGRPLLRVGSLLLGGPRLEQPTIVLTVLDTVRADHLGVCGYERPIGTFLMRLVEEEGASITCDARAPGSWTLPSHASFFTGDHVVAHGAHPVAGGGELLAHTKEQVRPLPSGVPTLAEQLAARGYQTVAVVENPVISEASGLLRGFEHVVRAGTWLSFEDNDNTQRAVTRLLKKVLDPERPLFLFLNVAGAHQPWPAVAKDAPKYFPRRPALRLYGSKEDSLWRTFLRDEMTTGARAEFLEHLVDVYDYGVWREERTLRRVWHRLTKLGWTRSARLVVTSDHGEFLGEGGLLDHGHYLDDPNSRVPLMYWSSDEQVALPRVVSGVVAYHLARDGALPAELPRVESVAFPHPERFAWSEGRFFGSTSAGIWDEHGVSMWVDGEVAGPGGGAVTELAERAVLSAEGAGSAALLEVLRTAGYVE